MVAANACLNQNEKDLTLSVQYIWSAQSCVCTNDLLTNFVSHVSEFIYWVGLPNAVLILSIVRVITCCPGSRITGEH
jgi:hypothetical protein